MEAAQEGRWQKFKGKQSQALAKLSMKNTKDGLDKGYGTALANKSQEDLDRMH